MWAGEKRGLGEGDLLTFTRSSPVFHELFVSQLTDIDLGGHCALGGSAIFIALTLMQSWDTRMHRNSRILEIYVELDHRLTLGGFMRQLREMGLEVSSVQTTFFIFLGLATLFLF